MKITVIITLVLFLCTNSFAQKKDSTKALLKNTRLNLFYEHQLYAHTKGNTYDFSQRPSAGGTLSVPLSKSFSLLVGSKISLVNNTYGMDSRGWTHFFYHGAVALLYTKGSFTFGPTAVRVSNVLTNVPKWRDTQKEFYEVVNNVRDSVPGIRGNYYNAVFLFVRFSKRKEKQSYDLELNLVYPGKIPSYFLSSWQPRGALVDAIRFKAEMVKKSFSLRLDARLPSVSSDQNVSYKNIEIKNATYRIEGGYLLNANIKFLIGYERDFHPLAFPSLAKGSKITFSAPYIGIRLQK